MFDRIQGGGSTLGLLSEDYDTAGPRMWGNFPQTYSHVGLIHAAFAASPHGPRCCKGCSKKRRFSEELLS